MRKIDPPKFAAAELFDESVAGYPDEALQEKFRENRDRVIEAFEAYARESETKTWCNLPRAAFGKGASIIVGNLTKAELVNLYDVGVVKSKGRPRAIYEKIKLAAHSECPYCGGIGEMGARSELATADHFLPKARFPVYSVLPLNLIPACDTCNTGMGSNFPLVPHLQPLHPYLDKQHFFDQKWTTASVREGLGDGNLPLVVDFDVAPPAEWSSKDRKRVRQHFADCNLASRYRSRVYQEVAPLISQRQTSLSGLNTEHFRHHLSIVADEARLPINGWKRTLYHALAASDWFCEEDFTTWLIAA